VERCTCVTISENNANEDWLVAMAERQGRSSRLVYKEEETEHESGQGINRPLLPRLADCTVIRDS